MYAAVLYGFLGLDFDLIPDFENEILEGEVYLKGSQYSVWNSSYSFKGIY